MRATVVPAQITTVEDKIAGNLTVTQLLLLMVPVFTSAIAYALLPSQFDFSAYKLILIGVITIIAVTLAIRVKEKILLDWLLLITRYNIRPRLYLFNKNVSIFRKVEIPLQVSKVSLPKAKESQEKIAITPIITENLKPFIELEYALATQSLSFKVREKGGYNVFVE
jgi:hypothetical protein